MVEKYVESLLCNKKLPSQNIIRSNKFATHAASSRFICHAQDKTKKLPRNKTRAQSSIKCKQMLSVGGKMADQISISAVNPQMNISAVLHDFFFRGIEGKVWLCSKENISNLPQKEN